MQLNGQGIHPEGHQPHLNLTKRFVGGIPWHEQSSQSARPGREQGEALRSVIRQKARLGSQAHFDGFEPLDFQGSFAQLETALGPLDADFPAQASTGLRDNLGQQACYRGEADMENVHMKGDFARQQALHREGARGHFQDTAIHLKPGALDSHGTAIHEMKHDLAMVRCHFVEGGLAERERLRARGCQGRQAVKIEGESDAGKVQGSGDAGQFTVQHAAPKSAFNGARHDPPLALHMEGSAGVEILRAFGNAEPAGQVLEPGSQRDHGRIQHPGTGLRARVGGDVNRHIHSGALQ